MKNLSKPRRASQGNFPVRIYIKPCINSFTCPAGHIALHHPLLDIRDVGLELCDGVGELAGAFDGWRGNIILFG